MHDLMVFDDLMHKLFNWCNSSEWVENIRFVTASQEQLQGRWIKHVETRVLFVRHRHNVDTNCWIDYIDLKVYITYLLVDMLITIYLVMGIYHI